MRVLTPKGEVDTATAPRAAALPASVTLDMPYEPRSVWAARHEVAAACQRWSVPLARAEAAELVVSELVGNAVVHARRPDAASLMTVRCWLDRRRRLHLAVTDCDPRLPECPGRADRSYEVPTADLPESGWGMGLVDSLAAIEVLAGDHGKTVHAVLR